MTPPSGPTRSPAQSWSFKMLAAAILTAATRTRVKQFLNPEDARTLGGAGVKEEHPDVLRMLRLHRNDLENILPFFTVGLIFVLMGASAFAAQVVFLYFHRRADRPHDHLPREVAAVEDGRFHARRGLHGRDACANSDRVALKRSPAASGRAFLPPPPLVLGEDGGGGRARKRRLSFLRRFLVLVFCDARADCLR